MVRSNAMTIGHLSKRTGEPIKVLRTYEALGFLSTRGRSEGNYRLFGEETLQPLAQALARIETRMVTLQELRQRILEFQAAETGASAPPAASALVQLLARDPCRDALPTPS